MRVHDPALLVGTRDGSPDDEAAQQRPKPDSPEALIEEARQHQRRRRMWFVVVVLTVVVGVVAGLTFSGGSGGSKPRAVTSTKPRAKHSTSPVPKKTISPATSNFCGSQPQMQFVNGNDGWLYMGERTILATTDQGRHWRTAYKGPDCVTSFDFVNASDGWALTGVDSQERQLPSSTILHTENGGRTWVSQHGPRGVGFLSMDMVAPTTGWAISSVGQLFHSVNAGDTWQRIPSPGPVQTLAAQSLTICSDSDGTWLALKDGNIVSSLPGTTTWTSSLLLSQVPPYGTNDDFYQTANLGCFGQTVWADYFFGCGAGTCWGQVERSIDGGAHWEALPGFGTDESLGGVTSTTDAWFLGYAFVRRPSVQATTNDGSTFRNALIYPQGGPQVEADVTTFVSASRGWAVVSLLKNEGTSSATSTPPELIGTDDGGTTWHVISSIPGL